MSGVVFVTAYVTLSVVVAAIWLSMRLAREPADRRTSLAAPIREPANPFVWRFTWAYRVLLVVGAAVTLLMAAMKLAAPWALVLVVDYGIRGNTLPDYLAPLNEASSTALIAIGAVASVVLAAASAGLGQLAAYFHTAAQRGITADIRTTAYARLEDTAVGRSDSRRSGEVLNQLSSEVQAVERMLSAWFGTVVPATPVAIGILVVMAAVDPMIAVAALATVTALAWRVRRFRHDGERSLETSSHTSAGSVRLAPAAEIVVAAGTAAVLYMAAARIQDGVVSIGVLFVLLAYAAQLYTPAGTLAEAILTVVRGTSRCHALGQLFGSRSRIMESPDAIDGPQLAAPLRVHDLAFGFDNTWPERITVPVDPQG